MIFKEKRNEKYVHAPTKKKEIQLRSFIQKNEFRSQNVPEN